MTNKVARAKNGESERPHGQARQLLSDARRCLIPGELTDANEETVDVWVAIHLIETALAEPGGDAAHAIRTLVKKHADKAKAWGCMSLDRVSRFEKFEHLDDVFREAVGDVEGPVTPRWARAYFAFDEWAHFFEVGSDFYASDAIGVDDDAPLRFLAFVALALPQKQRVQLEPIATKTLAASHHWKTRDEREQVIDALFDGLLEAWPRADIAVDHRWFLFRALEAMGEDVNAATAPFRMREWRARQPKTPKSNDR